MPSAGSGGLRAGEQPSAGEPVGAREPGVWVARCFRRTAPQQWVTCFVVSLDQATLVRKPQQKARKLGNFPLSLETNPVLRKKPRNNSTDPFWVLIECGFLKWQPFRGFACPEMTNSKGSKWGCPKGRLPQWVVFLKRVPTPNKEPTPKSHFEKLEPVGLKTPQPALKQKTRLFFFLLMGH